MSTEIVTTAGTITPVLVDGYQARRRATSRVHNILGSGDSDITLRPPLMRAGTLSLLFDSEAPALAALSALALPEIFSLNSDDLAGIGMSFCVPEGEDLVINLDDDTREVWIVGVPFQEVQP